MARLRIHRYLNRNGRLGWESILSMLLDDTCPPWLKAQFQLPLRGGPQRADVILIKKRGAAVEEVTFLSALYSRLDDQNLLELKGGTQRVGKLDPTRLLGYACQYVVREAERERVRRSKNPAAQKGAPEDLPQLKLIYLAPRITDAALEGVKARDGSLERTEPGVWEGRMAGFSLLFLETDLLWRVGRGNLLFYLNSFEGADPDEVKKEMTPGERGIYNRAIGMVQDGHETTEDDMAMTVMQKIAKRNAEYEREQVRRAPVELRLEGLTAEERLKGLPPEELRKALPPEERLKGLPPEELRLALPPEERLKGLPPEERLKGLPPEERLKGLPPEERLKGLPPEEKRRLLTSPDLLSLLPESMAQAIVSLMNPEPVKV